MKLNALTLSHVKLFLLLATLFMVFSCDNTKEPEPETKNYKLVKTINAADIKTLLNTFGLSDMAKNIKYNIDVYTYEYVMQHNNNNIKCSGIIAVPAAAGKSFPVLSFQHGTMVNHNSAPTVSYNSIDNIAILSIAGMGYIFAEADYVGFGASANYKHPYLVKDISVNNVVAMLNSMLEIPDGQLSGVIISDSLFISGYSQGGWLSLAMLEYFETTDNINNWQVIATACGAGPYYLDHVMDVTFNYQNYYEPNYLAYVFSGYLNYNQIEQPYSTYINSPYAEKIDYLYNGTYTEEQINAELNTNIKQLFTPGFIENYPDGIYNELAQAFKNNSVTVWNCQTPLLLVHGSADTDVTPTVTPKIYADFVETATKNVELYILDDMDHGTAAIPSIVYILSWFENFKK